MWQYDRLEFVYCLWIHINWVSGWRAQNKLPVGTTVVISPSPCWSILCAEDIWEFRITCYREFWHLNKMMREDEKEFSALITVTFRNAFVYPFLGFKVGIATFLAHFRLVRRIHLLYLNIPATSRETRISLYFCLFRIFWDVSPGALGKCWVEMVASGEGAWNTASIR